ncbi:uncharacterized protein LOC106883582 [Octopus bimaculoides]|uniref:Uncharacterized protein n=1 Tax=Octopus bimaculoides TaxID=37653 RepID=A0A0L8FG41_OCTBM|nr:uncharacterized protein LOC106883582 [Octopus bimaculoides]XP_014790132.1 uncharacterized protein LOC106883582 [Octopus bimaculoides]XP_014790133.1 uncharacterized protein LOC106883582 [Octopus bimaculoides]XP_014790134.1 uncharacterized protein LOC106883582 [Octopus bimaculoides]XP_014790135.1 uncharacterized protein LOC106883582 [Octopus bimaculoides]XP_014790136.1 uncharacterized protein LOC106883582 [Octopus bimaculoides]XP_052833960.1 uncharacterized protein LOC106883582 [Octopus bima|eukprot:XP_014790131.1 PREDICTED: uncharacterized protein LOC106883582 [Octopus bimaculoides]
MDILKFFCCLSALCCLASAGIYEIIQSENIKLNGEATLNITVPNMRRPVVWRCNNYKYECDRTCANGTNYKVMQSGNTSTLSITKVTEDCLTWMFADYNINFGTTDLKISNGAQGTSGLRTHFIFVIGIINAVII